MSASFFSQDPTEDQHREAIRREGFFFSQDPTDAVGSLEDDPAERFQGLRETEDHSQWFSDWGMFLEGFGDDWIY